MNEIKYIIYRRLTKTDFFNMYKPRRTEKGGGGQSYIDIPCSAVSSDEWQKFFEGLKYEETKSGPLWKFKINNIGLGKSQDLEIGQRRPQTFNIRGQKITSKEANRVFAWHPRYGFPQPKNPANRESVDNLVIYILKTKDKKYWAGWFQNVSPCKTNACEQALALMLDKSNSSGFLYIPKGKLYLDIADKTRPFHLESEKGAIIEGANSTSRQHKDVGKKTIIRQPRTEEEILKSLIDEDENYKPEEARERLVQAKKIRVRNQRVAGIIKELYKGKCQISKEKFAFNKKNGMPYAEIHHLIPLGDGGADSPFNLIVVNPLIHRMLHYADVEGIYLNEIEDNKLAIKINGKDYTITWHSKHARLILEGKKH